MISPDGLWQDILPKTLSRRFYRGSGPSPRELEESPFFLGVALIPSDRDLTLEMSHEVDRGGFWIRWPCDRGLFC